MSYCSRVYRQRNAHTHDEGNKQPFFSKQHDVNKSPQNNAFFQTKLTVNEPGDVYEREADSVANSVVNHSQNNKPVVQQKEISSVLKKDNSDEKKDELKNVQKKDAHGKEDEKKKPVQTKHESGATNNASPKVSSAIEQSAGKGNALAANALHEMSSSFGFDFSNVRVHNDSESATLNEALNAQAFTHGNDIYFDKGKYNPTNTQGKFLLAHELTHVVQQNNAMQSSSENIQRTIGDTRDLSSPRFKGDVELEACFDGEKVFRKGNKGEHIRKIQQALIDAGFQLPQFGADGSFGKETETAIKSFQQQSGLIASEQDGTVGPNTMSRLDSRFTRGSANTVEQHCANNNIKTITVDVAMMRGAGGDPAADIAFANNVFRGCCIQFRLGTQVTVPDSISDSVLGNDTDLLVGGCGATSAEDLNTFLTVTTLFELSHPIIAFYVGTLHSAQTGLLRGNSVTPICATGAAAPMEGMISIANGAGARTFSHEVAHVLMNTFGDHRVNTDNIQQVSDTATGEQVSSVQCDIMYTRAG